MTEKKKGRPRKTEEERKATTVYLPKSLYNSVRSFAGSTGQSTSDVITTSVSNFVSDPQFVNTLTCALSATISETPSYQNVIDILAGKPEEEETDVHESS